MSQVPGDGCTTGPPVKRTPGPSDSELSSSSGVKGLRTKWMSSMSAQERSSELPVSVQVGALPTGKFGFLTCCRGLRLTTSWGLTLCQCRGQCPLKPSPPRVGRALTCPPGQKPFQKPPLNHVTHRVPSARAQAWLRMAFVTWSHSWDSTVCGLGVAGPCHPGLVSW